MYGELSALHERVVDEWKSLKLRKFWIQFYSVLYSADETRVLWNALPDRTLAFKNGCVSGGKMSTEGFDAFNLC
jgi:hypothetical protein